MRLKELNTDHDEPRASLGDAPYAVGWSGQSHEWYGDLENPGEEGKGRYKPKGDGGRIVAINVPDYATAQKIEKKLDDSYNAGKFIDGNSVHGGMGDGYYVDYHSAWIRPMHEMDDEMWRLKYDKPKDFGADETNIDDAIKLATSMGGEMTNATKLISKKYGDEVLQNPKVQAALQHANENIQTEKQKAGPAGQLKGKDVIKKQKAGTTKNPTRDLLVGEVDTDEGLKIIRRDQPAAKVGSAVSVADRLVNRGAGPGAASVDSATIAHLSRRVSKIERAMKSIGESKISRAYFKELENKLTEIKEELKIREGDNIYHDCAKSFTHKVYGECSVIPGEHTLLENGTVTHYDATFTSCGNTYKVGNVAVENIHNVISEYHAHKKKKTKKKVKEAESSGVVNLGDVDIDATVDGLPVEPEKSPFSKDISDREKLHRDIHTKPELIAKHDASQKIKDVKHLTSQFDDIDWYKMIQYVNREKFEKYYDDNTPKDRAKKITSATLRAFKIVGPGTRNISVSSYSLAAHRYAGFKTLIGTVRPGDMSWDGLYKYFLGILKEANRYFSNPKNHFIHGGEEETTSSDGADPSDTEPKKVQVRTTLGNWISDAKDEMDEQETAEYIGKLFIVLASKDPKMSRFIQSASARDDNDELIDKEEKHSATKALMRMHINLRKDKTPDGKWQKSDIDTHFITALGVIGNSLSYTAFESSS